jgi:phosphatidylglycerophosphatase A
MASPPPICFLLAHPAHFIACGLGSGLSSVAPGTVGTAFAWVSYGFLRPHFSDLGFFVFLVAAFISGFWACQRAGRALGVPDHGSIVWDEIVPFWLVLFLTPPAFLWQAAAFGLFRLFDITKPWPASYFDQHQKNGFGVMMDDLVAAGFSLLALATAKFILG